MVHDINLTSQKWIDMIFEGKNKDYGAYTLRMTSPKRHLIAFVSVAILVLTAISIPKLTNSFGNNQLNGDKYGQVNMDPNLKLPISEEKPEPVKPVYTTPPPELISTIKFTAPVIKPDEQVKPEEEIISQTNLNKDNTAISIENVKGTDEDHGVDIATLKENISIVAEENTEEIHEFVEQPPSFPGGDAALMEYLGKSINYPTVAQENGVQGKVSCSFVVGKDGSIQDVKVERGVDASLDKEAARVIKSMPKWIPGRQGGNAVKVKFYLPVVFKLN